MNGVIGMLKYKRYLSGCQLSKIAYRAQINAFTPIGYAKANDFIRIRKTLEDFGINSGLLIKVCQDIGYVHFMLDVPLYFVYYKQIRANLY